MLVVTHDVGVTVEILDHLQAGRFGPGRKRQNAVSFLVSTF
jgi:hypothetical protein